MIFLFIRFFGFDFLHASAASKVVNVSTNLAAIGFFIPHGYYLPPWRRSSWPVPTCLVLSSAHIWRCVTVAVLYAVFSCWWFAR